jgi:hypothetical protein
MFSCLLFLNELSYSNDANKTTDEIVRRVLAILQAIRTAKRLRSDLLIAGSVPISKIAIAGGIHSLASLLAGNEHQDEWRFIKSLDQSSPGDSSWNFTKPHDLSDVTFQGQQTFGLLWAHANRSLVLSIALAATWEQNHVIAELQTLSELGDLSTSDISLPNISTSSHVEDHSNLILRIGRDESSSSVIYEGDAFVARIYFYDHDPPHFHVCSTGQPDVTLARFDIRTLDVLDGHLPSGLERTVRIWGLERKVQLMENWLRCSQGQLPFTIQE